jgi:hypothetical protein
MALRVLVFATVFGLLSGCFGSSNFNSLANDLPAAKVEGPNPLERCTGEVDPGRVTLRRLNRTEYDNTVRDLLGDTSAPGRAFPGDDLIHGYDNVADFLSASPILVERLEEAAGKVAAAAVAREFGASAPERPLLRTCDPAQLGDEACARQIVERFGRRAWRRPLTPSEIQRFTLLAASARADGDGFAGGIRLVLHAMLMSPSFLYRVELDPDPSSPAAHPLSAHELAARLSYFLWSSTPDEVLSARADDASILEPQVLEAEARRMAADPRASTLVTGFGASWLELRKIEEAKPDPTLFAMMTPALKAAMRKESELLFKSFLTEKRSALDLLDADFTFVNDALAAHYGMPPVEGAEHVRVSLAGSPRSGILTHAGMLTHTSHPTRTAPVKRGHWVLERMLCRTPPAPPPGVEGLSGKVDLNAPARVQMDQHRTNPTCAACHVLMDPIGLGMENFDAVGRFRTHDEKNNLVDPSGELPGGKKFAGPNELARALKTDPGVGHCISEHLFTYGVGRVPDPKPSSVDRCNVDGLAERFAAKGYQLSELVVELTRSRAFTHRRGEP